MKEKIEITINEVIKNKDDNLVDEYGNTINLDKLVKAKMLEDTKYKITIVLATQ